MMEQNADAGGFQQAVDEECVRGVDPLLFAGASEVGKDADQNCLHNGSGMAM